MKTVLLLDKRGDLHHHLSRTAGSRGYRLVRSYDLGNALSLLEGVRVSLIFADLYDADVAGVKEVVRSLFWASRGTSIVALSAFSVSEIEDFKDSPDVAIIGQTQDWDSVVLAAESFLQAVEGRSKRAAGGGGYDLSVLDSHRNSVYS